jgi:hypothetical protein
VADEAVQLATGTLLVLLEPQVIWVQLLDDVAVCGVHDATGTLGAPVVLQVVATQLLLELAAAGVQVPACTGVVVTMVWQSVRW